MKLAIFYHHIIVAARETGKEIPEVLEILQAEGLSGVEINVADVNPDFLAVLHGLGMEVSSIYGPVPLSESGETEKGLALVDTARAAACGRVMVLPGGYPEGVPEAETRTRILEGLRTISEYGAERGVTVTVEDFDDSRTTIGNSADMRFYGDRIPALYFTYDTGNFYTVEDPLVAFETIQDKIRHVHLKDYAHAPSVLCDTPRSLRSGAALYDVPFGAGALPGAEILRRLKGMGYTGYLCLEHTLACNMMEANLAAIRWVKQYI